MSEEQQELRFSGSSATAWITQFIDHNFYDLSGLTERRLTRSEWEAWQWTYQELPKPSFDQMLEYEKLNNLHSRAGFYGGLHNNPESIKQKHLDAVKTEVASKSIHTGKGLGHMAGLLQMVEQATIAGSNLPQILLQNKDGGTHRIQTQSAVREILQKVASNENKIESCHNIIMGKHKAATQKWQNKDLSLQNREAAADEARQILQHYEKILKIELEKYDPDELPSDLAELKEVLIEQLEAHALEKVKDLKGVKTQQGADLPAACLDSENAIRKVAEVVYKGSSIIDLSKTNKSAIANLQMYKDRIDKVSPLNTPLLVHIRSGLEDVSISKNTSEPYSIEAEAINLKIINPQKVASHLQYSVIHDVGSTIEETARTSSAIHFTLSRGSLATASFGIKARNICGPHRFKIVLNSPATETGD